jgi:hypothetical protein
MEKEVSFNIHAELYEDHFGDLAVRLADERVFRVADIEEDARFQEDARKALVAGERPDNWREMTPRELLYGGWRCITLLGYIDGDEAQPGIELEVKPDELGPSARSYLADVLG